MEKKWWVIAGILILIAIFFLSSYNKIMLSPKALAKNDGCWAAGGSIVLPPMTPEMTSACNNYCDEHFPGEPGCKEAVSQLNEIPATCFAAKECVEKHGLDESDLNKIYPPQDCEVKKMKDGSFEVDMDCEVCMFTLFSCVCKNVQQS
ncbi:hypothetical protein CO038_02525 [Candidatus Pacearchaeota archaeon CG_4_9_14_0_2_um_filter_39_13]|nr:hypothetical protein [Candidatus Pacearchaeota archaeon]OIO43558.1 MAG: hypothetical protein AUJ64_02075 [Candidatus Pacearchaeota archaeon CG1_02_39_14]PJC44659.1 MAG: hypothetical protein CO038_02525 [Candidatus Pacearchaeota archaeon CG_4_9_14_0_2_um_filter_39_13]